ncbi:unnamed protein product [Parnassius apollo]|uniref:(apollo) hypothetical protein n=1 Tax=Parnassius apollo TaxID=110799 RepID=A0A8S3Y9D5_PARAO|nr:unnamed protein product [Parnassius apollo]
MVCLIQDINNLSDYGKAVKTFVNISLQPDDNLPKNMCGKCFFLLKQVIFFKLNCESSDKKLKNLVELSNITLENLMENLVQYSMYNIYFPTELSSYVREKYPNGIDQQNRNKEKMQLKATNTETCNEQFIQSDSMTTHSKMEIESNHFDQNTNTESESELNNTQNDEYLLDIMEKMIDKHLNIVNGDLKHCKKKRILRRRKLFKSKHQTQIRGERLKKNTDNKTMSLMCKICLKVLANQLTYDHHMQRHNGCRYICEHCGKGFPVQAELKIHQVVRHGTGPYLQCHHCSFKAPRKFDLIEHERIHTGERPYTCDKCGLTFRRRGIWKKHLIYHMEKKIQCTQCPRKFYQRGEMLAHANNVHHRVYVYLCNKCGATYAKPATVRRHLTERHGIPREMQGKVIRVNKGSNYNKQLG